MLSAEPKAEAEPELIYVVIGNHALRISNLQISQLSASR